MNAERFRDDDLREGLDLELFKKLFSYIVPYRMLALRLIAIMLAFAALDAVIPLLTKTAIDTFAVPGRTEGLRLFGLLCVSVAVARGVAVLLMIITGGRIYTSVSHDLRRDGFNHLQTLSFSYFDQHATGWLMARLTSDARDLGRVLSWGVVDLSDGIGRVLLMAGIMLALDVKLACVVLAIVPLLVLALARFQKISMARYREVRKINSEITAGFNEGILGARTSKTLVREDADLAEFTESTNTMYDVSTAAVRYSAIYLPVVLVLGVVGSAAALWIGGKGIADGRVSYGTLVAFMSYAVSFFQPLQDLARRFPELQNARAAAERIFSLLETEPDIIDRTKTSAAAAGKPVGARPESLPGFTGNIQFEHVFFAYKKEEPVLADFNLSVTPGETLAIVGPTGAGKTTIASLVCRFYEPTAGTIRIDGTDYTSLSLDRLRSNLGIVQQDPHLFSGSIADNIRYGKLDADDSEIEKAARLVHATGFINRLPKNFHFQVGENGKLLSSGQKQLVALARVMLANPGLLILDEATSSVDTQTERLIQKAILKVLENRTSLIIAHRLSTIRSADRILYLDDGRIVEQGSHHQLILRKGAYYRLYQSQFITEKEADILS